MTPINISDQPELLVIEISDLMLGETAIKRKAICTHLVVDIERSNVTLSWRVEFYESINGGYGEKIEKEGINAYSKSFNTRPDDWVDATGASIPLVPVYEKDELGNNITMDAEGNPIAPIMTRPDGTVSAYRYFNHLAFQVPVKIADVMRANGLKQNALNKF